MDGPIPVSVVIPARNAGATLAETLQSLQAQTHTAWDAIVVDDGSSDDTAEVVERFREGDARIRLLRREGEGVCAARNAGLALVRHDWLLFLDADDWIEPEMLARLTAESRSHPGCGVMACAWVRITPSGEPSKVEYRPFGPRPFLPTACACPFAIHAAIVRRDVVEAVGAFDPTLRTCEDWDLWQRIARRGTRFGWVPEPLARYRMRERSASNDGGRMLADGLRVIARGHRPDPRVPDPDPEFADGRPPGLEPHARFVFACWPAGLHLGSGSDPVPLLDALGGERCPVLDPDLVATSIFYAMPLPTCRQPADLAADWSRLAEPIETFLAALEAKSGAPRLARRVAIRLEALAAKHATCLPCRVGGALAIEVELTEAIQDVPLPAPIDRVRVNLTLEGEPLGALDLPAGEDRLPAEAIARAAARDYGWAILAAFLQRNDSGVAPLESALARALPRGAAAAAVARLSKKQLEWGTRVALRRRLAQELWSSDAGSTHRTAERGVVRLEVGGRLPSINAGAGPVRVELSIGGEPLEPLMLPRARIASARLRRVLLAAHDARLVAAVVRTAILERPLAGVPLRARLSEAALRRIPERSEGDPRPVRRASVLARGQRVLQRAWPALRRRAGRHAIAERVPILMYHSVSDAGPEGLEDYRVTPAALDDQLRLLRDQGYASIGLEEWRDAMTGRRLLRGRPIILTFDDGFRDFHTHAWPALRRHGFGAIVFLVTGEIGGVNAWDLPAFGEGLPLMDWAEVLALQEEGVTFGSHSVTHAPLTALSCAAMADEARRSRERLEHALSRSVTAFAYPYGDNDPVVRHVIGSAGYTYGLSCRPGPAGLYEPLLDLPRIEIAGGDTLEAFAAKVTSSGGDG